MDEFEKLEQELISYYDLYVLKFRCLAFLEQQLEEVEKSEVNQVRVIKILSSSSSLYINTSIFTSFFQVNRPQNLVIPPTLSLPSSIFTSSLRVNRPN